MSLYRLDFSYPDGRIVPVRDPIVGGDYLTRSRVDARQFARNVSLAVGGTADAPSDIVCTRIYGAGAMRESFRVMVI